MEIFILAAEMMMRRESTTLRTSGMSYVWRDVGATSDILYFLYEKIFSLFLYEIKIKYKNARFSIKHIYNAIFISINLIKI